MPVGSDSSGSQKDEIRSVSSEEFLAMERSAELDAPLRKEKVKELTAPVAKGKIFKILLSIHFYVKTLRNYFYQATSKFLFNIGIWP